MNADDQSERPIQYPGPTTDLSLNLENVNRRIEAARRKSPFEQPVRLLPVSKTVDVERIRTAITLGCTQLGENRVQEAHRKWEELSDTGVSWSVIGHLQSNKARKVAQFADEFQALDSLKVAEALDRQLQAAGRELDVFVQVNTSNESSKFGLHPTDVPGFVERMPHYTALKVRGLMTLAVFSTQSDRVRGCFTLLRELRNRLLDNKPEGVELGELSMGMSGDFEIAIEEGATVVRVGQAIFGARRQPNAHYWPDLPA
ncbi:YggS family pyridoxal phosphate enzyme (plasmid) [Rhodococcus qingshengii]|uniref:YggS family pyridoxal phosphate-dependent enzyme n=1 Tax=Rhodococcus qingshengii TaxID=334542 RepID=UPI0007E5B88F|nr:YggS family pyridoxal phosphate-dependent enzyme [Rhodococcus qingshengii]BCF86674.1 YggS family pyridoxal phosphate enzyme [Rhodococcus qingshengii]